MILKIHTQEILKVAATNNNLVLHEIDITKTDTQ